MVSRQKFAEKCVSSMLFTLFILLIFKKFLLHYGKKRRANEGREEQGTKEEGTERHME